MYLAWTRRSQIYTACFDHLRPKRREINPPTSFRILAKYHVCFAADDVIAGVGSADAIAHGDCACRLFVRSPPRGDVWREVVDQPTLGSCASRNQRVVRYRSTATFLGKVLDGFVHEASALIAPHRPVQITTSNRPPNSGGFRRLFR